MRQRGKFRLHATENSRLEQMLRSFRILQWGIFPHPGNPSPLLPGISWNLRSSTGYRQDLKILVTYPPSQKTMDGLLRRSSLRLRRLDKSMDKCARGTLRPLSAIADYGRRRSKLGERPAYAAEGPLRRSRQGRCFGGLRRRNEGYHGRKPVEASFFSGNICGSLASTELTVLGNPYVVLRSSTFLFLYHFHCINLVQKKTFLP